MTGQTREGGHRLQGGRRLFGRQMAGVESDRHHPGRWGRGRARASQGGQRLQGSDQPLDRGQGDLGLVADRGLAGAVHEQQVGGLAAPQQRQGGGGARVADGALPLHQHQGIGPGPLGRVQHRLLHRPGGVINPHRIEGQPTSGDQNAGLARGHETGIDSGPQRGRLQLKAGAHLPHRHVGTHRQQASWRQGCCPGRSHHQVVGFAAQVPDPAAWPQQGRQLGIIAQAAVEAIGHRQPRLQPHHQIGVEFGGQAATGGS